MKIIFILVALISSVSADDNVEIGLDMVCWVELNQNPIPQWYFQIRLLSILEMKCR